MFPFEVANVTTGSTWQMTVSQNKTGGFTVVALCGHWQDLQANSKFKFIHLICLKHSALQTVLLQVENSATPL